MKSIFYEIILKLGFALIRIALKRKPKIRSSSTDVDFRVRIAKHIQELDSAENKKTTESNILSTSHDDVFGSNNEGVDKI